MANTKSAQKAARQTIRRTAVNKSRRTEMRTYVRKVEEAIASKDPKAAAEALSAAEPRLPRAAQKGIVHKNAASRKISRLTKRVKALAGSSFRPGRSSPDDRRSAGPAQRRPLESILRRSDACAWHRRAFSRRR